MIGNIFNFLGKRKAERIAGTEKICSLKPSPFDERDFTSAVTKEPEKLPESFDINGYTIKQQGNLGSCFAQAVCSAKEVMEKNKNERILNLSELFLWQKTRISDVPQSGGYIRDALKFAQQNGIALEYLCPYDVNMWNKDPSFWAEFSARYFRIGNYYRIYTDSEIKAAIYAGYPVVFGMRIYQDRLRVKDGIIQDPEGDPIGGHAMLLTGWNPIGYKDVNSWGLSWGSRGTAILPYSLAKKEAFEFWRFESCKVK